MLQQISCKEKSGYVILELVSGSCEQDTKLGANFCFWYVCNLFLRCGIWGEKTVAEGFGVKNFHVSIFSISTMSEGERQKMSQFKGQ